MLSKDYPITPEPVVYREPVTNEEINRPKSLVGL